MTRSHQAATPSSGPSASTVPTSWTANGNPASSRPLGRLIAGTPSVLQGAQSEPSPVPSARVGAEETATGVSRTSTRARQSGPRRARGRADPFRGGDLGRRARLPGEHEVADGRPVVGRVGREPRLVRRGGPGLEEDLAGVGQAVERRRQLDLHDPRPGVGEPAGQLVEVAPQARFREVDRGADHADARRVDRRDVDRVPHQHALDQRGVRHGPGDRPGMVQRPRERHDPIERDRAVRPLAADDPAVGRGSQDRADGLRADRGRDHPRRDGRGRPRRRAARRVPERPRVPRRRRVAVGELGRVGLAEDHGPGVAEPRHQRRVDGRERVGERGRARAGRHARDIDDVLDPDRDPVQRPERPPVGQRGIALACLGERGPRVHVDPGLDGRLELVDALEARGGQPGRGPLAGSDPARPPR